MRDSDARHAVLAAEGRVPCTPPSAARMRVPDPQPLQRSIRDSDARNAVLTCGADSDVQHRMHGRMHGLNGLRHALRYDAACVMVVVLWS